MISNTGNTPTRLRVNAVDTGAVRANQSILPNSVDVTNIYDVNRDGRVNAVDTGLVRSNQQIIGIVAPITAPSLRGEGGFGRLGLGRSSGADVTAAPAVKGSESSKGDFVNDAVLPVSKKISLGSSEPIVPATAGSESESKAAGSG